MEQTISNTNQYLAFRLGDENFAFDVNSIKEVLEVIKITKVPQTPEMMKGGNNLSGHVVPVIDLRIKLGMGETEKTVETVIIIIELEMEEGEISLIGVLVDSVNEVINLDAEHIEPPPSIGTGLNTNYIDGMGKSDDTFIILLNTSKIFTEEELLAVQEVSETEADPV